MAEATREGDVQVRWRSVVDPDDSEITYEVFRDGRDAGVDGTSQLCVVETPTGELCDKNVTPGTTYSYRVRATDGTSRAPCPRLSPPRRTLGGELCRHRSRRQPFPVLELGDVPDQE